MKVRQSSAFICAAIISLVGAPAFADDKEQKVELQNIPAVVRATAEQAAVGGKIVEAELEEEDGQPIYSVELKTAEGGDIEVEVALDGKLLKVEKEDDDDDDEKEEKITLEQAPAGVQTAVAGILTEGTKLEEVIKEQEHGVTVYEVEYKVADIEHSLKLSAGGAVLEEENAVSTDTLTAEVASAIKKRYPNATVKEAEQVTLRFFEMEIVEGGKTREVKVSAAGQILSGDDDDEDDVDESEEDDD